MGQFYNEEAIKQREAAIAQQGQTQKRASLGIVVILAVVLIAAGWWRHTHNPDTMIVDVNKASVTELQYLPGVGKVTAEAIVQGRPYKTAEDLRHVKGIGEKTFEKMKSRVKVEP